MGPAFRNIDTALRLIHSNTKYPKTKLTIASAYYIITFPSANKKEVLGTALEFYNTLKTLDDKVLDAMLDNFNQKVIQKLINELRSEH